MTVTTYDLAVASATSPLFHALAGLLPKHNGWGRPRHHASDLTSLVYGACRRIFESYRRVDREFAQQWPAIRAACRAHGVDLGDRPPSYNHWESTRARALSRLDDLKACFTSESVALARDHLGLLDPSAGSLTHPDRSQVVFGDGTHLRGKFTAHLGEWVDAKLGPCMAEFDLTQTPDKPTRLLKKEDTGWIAYDPDSRRRIGTARIDVDATIRDKYPTTVERGSGKQVRLPGHGLILWHVRGRRPYTRVTLALGLQEKGGEAEVALRELLTLREIAGDGLRAFAYDMAMRGTHIEQAMRHGMLPFVKVVAESNTDDQRTPFENPLGTVTHRDGAHEGCRHQLLVVDGAIKEAVLDATGELQIAHGGRPLEITQIKRTQNRLGHSFSVGVRIPCRRGDFVHWLTLPAPRQGRRHALKINLDKLRPHPPGCEAFQDIYGVRNDAEAANAEYKKHLLDTRASSIGADRNLLDAMLFFAGQNALNVRRHVGQDQMTRAA